MAVQLLIFALFAVALVVAAGLLARKNMWKWICLYWVILTVKNFLDWIRGL